MHPPNPAKAAWYFAGVQELLLHMHPLAAVALVASVLVGLALLLVGLLVLQNTVGWILAIVGLVPLLAGIFDRCVFAPLFGLPFVGPRLRQA